MSAPEFGYYHVDIAAPATGGRPAYTAECQDIIDALGMTFAEGCAFKAIWRNAAARTLGKVKPGSQGGLYDARKVAYYGQRMVVAESNAQPSSTIVQHCFVAETKDGAHLEVGETITFAVPPAAPEKLPLLPIVVGGRYRTRGGDEVEIIEGVHGDLYPFAGSNDRTYDRKGFEYEHAENPTDLVERIA